MLCSDWRVAGSSLPRLLLAIYTDGFEQAVVIEPRHPFECRELYGLLCLPGRPVVNQLRPVEPVVGFMVLARTFSSAR